MKISRTPVLLLLVSTLLTAVSLAAIPVAHANTGGHVVVYFDGPTPYPPVPPNPTPTPTPTPKPSVGLVAAYFDGPNPSGLGTALTSTASANAVSFQSFHDAAFIACNPTKNPCIVICGGLAINVCE